MSDPKRTLTGILLVAASGLAFGMLSIFNRQAGALGLGVPTLLAFRFLIAAAALWAWLLARGGTVRIPLGTVLGLMAMGALYVVEAGLYFLSARRIPVALTAVLLYLYPALVAVVTWLRGRHPFTGRDALALGLSLGGTALAVGRLGGATDTLGVLMGLATAVGYTTYLLLGERVQRGLPTLQVAACVITTAGFGFLGWALATDAWQPMLALQAWKPLLGIAFLCTVLPIPLHLAGLARIGAPRAAMVSTTEPISAACFGALLLNEIPTPMQALGALFILGAVVLLAVERSEAEPLPER
ncbi:MAG TPA: DMT family transporter [Holophagaceae bacterium]|nr:DMT family transporter [Holophagaceae bacterium]